jgi:nucleoside-diphosphate-sugar epimerase
VRLAGLYGSSRQPGRFLAGRTNVSRPRAPVNLIHRDDAIGAIVAVLERAENGLVVNACASTHPTREHFYTTAARVLDLKPPTFDSSDTRTGKRIDNQRLLTHVGYVLQHPDVLVDLDRGS